jgi:hypothetical protein
MAYTTFAPDAAAWRASSASTSPRYMFPEGRDRHNYRFRRRRWTRRLPFEVERDIEDLDRLACGYVTTRNSSSAGNRRNLKGTAGAIQFSRSDGVQSERTIA